MAAPMSLQQHSHPVRLQAAFFASGGRSSLHRYLDPDFVNRFRLDVQRARFDQPQFSAWLSEERHSPHDDKPVLRLPVHRAFHVVCCEIVCDRPGSPALDPARVRSAGFVIRRVGESSEKAWMLEEAEPRGWEDAATERRDPDLHRRLCDSGLLHERADVAAYSGEEVHPLHVLRATDRGGKSHTLLYGFLPLGGFHYLRAPAAALDPASKAEVDAFAAAQLPWPFGYRSPHQPSWQAGHERPIAAGHPRKEFFELLRQLVYRYHLGEPARPENDGLEKWAERLILVNEAALPSAVRALAYSDATRAEFAPHRQLSLWDYLRASFANADNALVRWLIREDRRIEAAGGLANLAQLGALPAADGQSELVLTLLMSAADAQELRELLGQRLNAQTLAKLREIPVPKFGQRALDVYQVVPFVRLMGDSGKEQIEWVSAAGRSEAFRVAAPFEPNASRPALIQMPTLADLKRGLANGVSLLTPPDTFDLMNALKFNEGATADALPSDPPPPGVGLQWICSFSLPVITLVAMILLTIMISLLNIVFFWLPWVRICLPFPKLGK